MSANNRSCKFNSLPLMGLITVLTVLVQTTQAQAYLLALSQNPNVYPYRAPYEVGRSAFTLTAEIDENQRNSTTTTTNNAGFEDNENPLQKIDDNSTIIFIKNSNSSDLSQTAMDVITIVWYVATFLALAAFFLLMACSDRRCSDSSANGANNQNDAPIPPPTPSPSYSEFAPPSYDIVMKEQPGFNGSVFIIPLDKGNTKENGNSNSINNNNNSSNIPHNTSSNTLNVPSLSQPPTPTTPMVNFYTINELQKLGS